MNGTESLYGTVIFEITIRTSLIVANCVYSSIVTV